MKIKTTYIGKTASGVSAIWCGFKPESADITREYKILNTASRARSEVGRTVSDSGENSFLPR